MFDSSRCSRAGVCSLSALLLGLVIPAGCGTPTIDDRYPGKPTLTVKGDIVGFQEGGSQYPLKASLFWSPTGRFDAKNLKHMHEDASVQVHMKFPSSFTLNVYKPPRKEWMVPGKGYAVGAVVVYEDTLGKGRYVAGRTPIRGGVFSTAVFYAPSVIPQEKSPFNTTIGPGMMSLDLPLPCGNVSFPDEPKGAPSSRKCPTTNIGDPCTKNSDCAGPGICLSSLDGVRLPNGYCSLKGNRSCPPSGAVAMGVFPQNSSATKIVSTYYLRACSRDSHCGRGDGYRCDPFTRACLPTEPVILEFEPKLSFQPFCYEFDDSKDSEVDEVDEVDTLEVGTTFGGEETVGGRGMDDSEIWDDTTSDRSGSSI